MTYAAILILSLVVVVVKIYQGLLPYIVSSSVVQVKSIQKFLLVTLTEILRILEVFLNVYTSVRMFVGRR